MKYEDVLDARFIYSTPGRVVAATPAFSLSVLSRERRAESLLGGSTPVDVDVLPVDSDLRVPCVLGG